MRLGFRGRAAAAVMAVALQAAPAASVAQEAVRPAVGKPLEAAKSDLAAHDFAAATKQVAIAERQKGVTAYESFLIKEMKAAIAQQAGDIPAAREDFAEIVATKRLSGAALQQVLLAEVSLAYQAKDYPGVLTTAQQYYAAGGKNPAVRVLVIQADYLQKDYRGAAGLQLQVVNEELAAKKQPTESELQLLAACQKATGDAGLAQTMRLLVTYYPKKDYWAELVYGVQKAPGFSDHLDLSLDELKLKVGLITTEPDFMEMIQLALGDNNPGKALDVIAAAKASGTFGQPASADRENRLMALAQSTAASAKAGLDAQLKQLQASPATTSEQLFDLGMEYAGFHLYDQGVPLMQQAIAKGDLQRAAQARLLLAEALIDAGQKPQALAALRDVPQTTDGSSDLAELWSLWLTAQPG